MSIQRAEQLLRLVPQVTGCRIRADADGQPVAVLVTAAPGSQPKAVLADVITVLGAQAGFDVMEDQVRVVVLDAEPAAAVPEVTPEPVSELVAEPLENEGRLRLLSYDTQVSEAGTTAHAELGWGPRATAWGEAQSHGAGEVPELLAAACLDAIEKLCHGRVALRLAAFRRVVVGRFELACVVVQETSGRETRSLSGAARIGDDVARAAAYAALDGMNRRVGRILAAPAADYLID